MRSRHIAHPCTWGVWVAAPILTVSMLLLAGCGGGSSHANITTVGGGGGGGGGQTAGAFFGMHVNFSQTPWPNEPVAGLRMWDDASSWALVSTGPGSYDWTPIDFWLQQAQTHGADVLYDLARTPVWAQCAPSDTTCGSGDTTVTCAYSQLSSEGGPGQCFPPSDLHVDGTGPNQIWINWVTDVATHSVNSTTAHIKYYEIWNEPNTVSQWQGTAQQLVRMAQDAQCIIKGKNCNSLSTYSKTGIDPSAVVLTPAFTGTTQSDVTTAMQGYLQAGGGQYADAIAFHGYLGPNPPEQFANVYSAFSGMLSTQSQQTKQVFNTEASWGVNNPILDPDKQAAWLSRYILLQASLGVTRFYWYSWDVSGVNLWSSSGGTTPAGVAFGQMNKWLTGATVSSACSAQGTLWTCGFTRSGGYQALAVWDTSQTCGGGSCTTASYSVPAQYTQYLDIAGNTNPISAGNVAVGLKPILLESGNIP